jgi:hypothetical protein
VNYGNDGNHYNDSINKPPNTVVSQQVADAIHYASDHIPVFLTLRFEQNNIQMTVSINDGWNIISVPLIAPDMTASILFPTAISTFYSFTNSYNQVFVLENGEGYWAKFSGNQNTTISGTFINTAQISVTQGWNLIGPFSIEVPVAIVTTVPPNILASPFYSYQGSYVSVTILQPGKGYWIKSNVSGSIFFNTDIENMSKKER